MKPLLSENYYKEQSHLYENNREAIDPEHLLENILKTFDGILSNEDLEKIKPIYVKQVIEEVTEKLNGQKELYYQTRNKKVCFGYSDTTQEMQAQGNYIRIFEYNCYKLAEFKKAHLS